MNKLWHAKNKLAKNATQAERLKWHLEHHKQCNCRPMPEDLQKILEAED